MKMKVSEPAVAYNTPYLQSLKNRIIASLDTTTDERKLQECLALLHADEMPGIYLMKSLRKNFGCRNREVMLQRQK